MTNWQEIKLGDVCRINTDSFLPKEQWNFVNYLDTGNITKNKINIIQYIDLTKEKLPSRARRKVKENNIVYSTVRPNQLHYGLIKNQPENFLVSTGFAVLDINLEIACPRFIYYSLTQEENTKKLHAIAEQSVSAYPSIKPSDIENVDIILPDIKTQKQIAAILGALDDKIELNNKINNNLEQQAQALFKSWFIDFEPFGGKLPEDWNVGTIADIIELHDSKRIPLSSNQREKMKKIYPYYGATSQMDYVEDYLFDGIYLLLGEDGTVVDHLGFPILQYVWGKFWVNNHAHIITGKQNFSVETLYLLFKQTSVSSIVTGAVQPKISQANLKALPAIIPSSSVILEFNGTISPIFSLYRANIEENTRLTQLRDTLLPKLMTGEIDVSKVDISELISADKSSFTEKDITHD